MSSSPLPPTTEVHSISSHNLSLNSTSTTTSSKIQQQFTSQTIQSDLQSDQLTPLREEDTDQLSLTAQLDATMDDLRTEEENNPDTFHNQSLARSNIIRAASLASGNGIEAGTSNIRNEEPKLEVSNQLPTTKNGIFQSRTTNSQSPFISSTISASQGNNPPQGHMAAPALKEECENKFYIPRLIDGSVKDGSKVKPKLWTPKDVAQFLKTNDCGAYCENFITQVSVSHFVPAVLCFKFVVIIFEL